MDKKDFLALGLDEDVALKCVAEVKKALSNYVKKTDYNILKEEKANLEKRLHILGVDTDTNIDEVATQIKEHGIFKDKITSLEDELAKAKNQHATELHKIKLDTAVEKAINSANGKSAKAIRAFLNLENVEFNEDGTVKGLEEQLKELSTAEDTAFLFNTLTEKAGIKIKGATIGQTNIDNGQVDINKMTYSQLMNYMSENPNVDVNFN